MPSGRHGAMATSPPKRISIAELRTPPEVLRATYLRSLPEAQDAFLEDMATAGVVWGLALEGHALGYAIILHDMLVECHLNGHANLVSPALHSLRQATGVRSVLVKSFDLPLRAALDEIGLDGRVAALLYREVAPRGFFGRDDVFARRPRMEEARSMVDPAEGFLRPGDVEDFVLHGWFVAFENRAGKVFGFAVAKRVTSARPEVEFSMFVKPFARGQGLGVHIVDYMASLCESSGSVPVCSSAVWNLASQRTLERAGFRSRHTLLQYNFEG